MAEWSAVTALLAPFTGFVPVAEFASRVVGPSRSMLSAEQQQSSRDDELSFRSSVGRGAGADHTNAMEWMRRCHDAGALAAVESVVLVHRLERVDYRATGLIAEVSVAAYDTGLIKRHETTIAKTERKMVDYMQSTRLYGNPVALAHHEHPEVAVALSAHTQRPPDVEFDAIDGTHHSMWIVEGADAEALCSSFSDVLYITDGHHRLAAASTLAAVEGRSDPHLPVGLFAENELELWAYARGVRDASIDTGEVLKVLRRHFSLEDSELAVPRPTRPHELGVRIDGRSYILTVPDDRIPVDTYDKLDVNLLQDLILEPVLGVTNPRTDARLSFIADTSDAAHDPDEFDVWFLPYPTAVRDVMAVADMGRAMPPKSTFFLPKLPSGLIVRTIDQ